MQGTTRANTTMQTRQSNETMGYNTGRARTRDKGQEHGNMELPRVGYEEGTQDKVQCKGQRGPTRQHGIAEEEGTRRVPG